jgi:hypothetical protein
VGTTFGLDQAEQQQDEHDDDNKPEAAGSAPIRRTIKTMSRIVPSDIVIRLSWSARLAERAASLVTRKP